MKEKMCRNASQMAQHTKKMHGANTDYKVLATQGATEFYNVPSHFPANNPLKKGTGRLIISSNIREMMHSGYKQPQAVAASLEQARRSGAKIPRR